MTGTGSGDVVRESRALDETGDAAPPDIRNGPKERLGANAGVHLGAATREREAARPRFAGISVTPRRVGGRR